MPQRQLEIVRLQRDHDASNRRSEWKPPAPPVDERIARLRSHTRPPAEPVASNR